jgi:hypothetical protein
MAPCGFAVGIAGALPQAGCGAPFVIRRDHSAAPPTTATTRAKTCEKLNALFPDIVHILAEVAHSGNVPPQNKNDTTMTLSLREAKRCMETRITHGCYMPTKPSNR